MSELVLVFIFLALLLTYAGLWALRFISTEPSQQKGSALNWQKNDRCFSHRAQNRTIKATDDLMVGKNKCLVWFLNGLVESGRDVLDDFPLGFGLTTTSVPAM